MHSLKLDSDRLAACTDAGPRRSATHRVIFVNRFFYPDHSATSEILSDLAFALSDRGVTISVITSRQSYEAAAAKLPAREQRHGVDVWRMWTTRYGRQRLVGRSLDYLTFYLAAMWRVARLARAGDIIVAKTDPPLLSIAIAPIARMRRAHLVNWLQDVFPEVALGLNVGAGPGRLTFGILKPLRDWSLRAAKVNVVVGTKMAARLGALGIPADRIRIVPNWADGALIAPSSPRDNALRKEWTPESRFVAAYAGNLGRAHDIGTIVAALALLQDRAKRAPEDDVARQLMFVLVGGGAQRAELERQILKRGLTNVRLRAYQPRERLAETLGMADVHLVSLNPKLEGLIVPSKFYGIAAAGRPTLFIGAADGEIAGLIDHAGCGFTVAPGDAEGLAARLLEFANDPDLCARLGARARQAFEQGWDKSYGIRKWEILLRDIGGTLAAPPHAAQGRPPGPLPHQ